MITTDARRPRLAVDMTACDGRGLCAEVLPELIVIDDWGFPIIAPGAVPERLQDQAGEAVRLCPKLALRLERDTPR
jgi:ferredoxin